MAEGMRVEDVHARNGAASAASASALAPAAGFAHEALLYEGECSFLRGAVPFVQRGLAAGEGVLVMVRGENAEALQRALGPQARAIEFVGPESVGDNPARAIPLWQRFVDEHASPDRPVRGVSEAVRPTCSDAVSECLRHEELLNVAFGRPGASRLRLLCPYDLRREDAPTIEVARRTHQHLWCDGSRSPSDGFRVSADPLLSPLPEPAVRPSCLQFDVGTLAGTRAAVSKAALRSGLSDETAAAAVLAVNELTSNSVRYGGGRGTLCLWCEGDVFVCEVRDRGTITDPLVGCIRPTPFQERGRGLWLVNQICDMVRLHSSPSGTVVRISFRRDGEAPAAVSEGDGRGAVAGP